MSRNHSRYSHQQDKLYAQVSLLQGAMVTDADQREAQEVAERSGAIRADMALATGVPADGGVLDYDRVAGPPDIVSVKALRPGRVVAQGVWGEVRLTKDRQLGTPPLDLLGKQADFLASRGLADNGSYLVYADIWDRHVGPAEDARLLDAAFLGAETSVRKARMAQIKLVETDAFSSQDRARVETGLPPFGDLRLKKAELAQALAAKDDCDPCASAGTVDLAATNALFRVEIHASGICGAEVRNGKVGPKVTETKVTLKYSHENAAIEIPGEGLAQLTADAAFAGRAFEIASVTSEQQLGLVSPNADPRAAELMDMAKLKLQGASDLAGKIIRVWDGAVTLDLAAADLAPVLVAGSAGDGTFEQTGDTSVLRITLGGVKLEFTADTAGGAMPYMLPGDAWTVEIREFAGATGSNLHFQPDPVEAVHRYVYLGQVDKKAFLAESASSDMRSRAVPALSALEAQQVRWSNHHHTDQKTNTVQGALDLLFGREQGDCQCTFCIDPTRTLEEQLDEIAAKLSELNKKSPDERMHSALICLPRGVFRLRKPFALQESGFITLKGAGREATEISLDDGATLAVYACEGLAVEDLMITSADPSGSALLEVQRVQTVDIARAMFVCAGAKDDGKNLFPAVDIIQSGLGPEAAVRVSDSIFEVGDHHAALHIDSDGMQVVRDCQFLGVAPHFPRHVFGFLPGLLGGIKFMDLPMNVKPGKESGLYEVAPGKALNLTHVPLSEREAVMEFIRGNQAVFDARDLGDAGKWAAFRDKVTVGAAKAIAPAVTPAPAAPAPAPGGGRGVAATGGGAMITRRRGGTGQPATGGAMALSFRRGGPAIAVEAAEVAGIIGSASGPIVAAVDALAGRDLRVISDLIGTLINRSSLASYRRVFGVVLQTGERARATLSGNVFRWVHSAIVVDGRNAVEHSPVMPLTSRLTVSGNTILRAAIKGVSQAHWDGESFPAAITCAGVGYLRLESNLVQQDCGGDSGAGEYIDYLSPLSHELSEGICAIELRGAVGPVVHATANDAVYCLTCIGVSGSPAFQGRAVADERYRNNIWTFRDNSVLPTIGDNAQAVRGLTDLGKWTDPGNGMLALGVSSHSHNHPSG